MLDVVLYHPSPQFLLLTLLLAVLLPSPHSMSMQVKPGLTVFLKIVPTWIKPPALNFLNLTNASGNLLSHAVLCNLKTSWIRQCLFKNKIFLLL